MVSDILNEFFLVRQTFALFIFLRKFSSNTYDEFAILVITLDHASKQQPHPQTVPLQYTGVYISQICTFSYVTIRCWNFIIQWKLKCLLLKFVWPKEAESPDSHAVMLIVKTREWPTRWSLNYVCITYGLRFTNNYIHHLCWIISWLPKFSQTQRMLDWKCQWPVYLFVIKL